MYILLSWKLSGIQTKPERIFKNMVFILTIGSDAIGCILVVVYAYRGDNIRLISARPATKKERGKYEERI